MTFAYSLVFSIDILSGLTSIEILEMRVYRTRKEAVWVRDERATVNMFSEFLDI